MMKNKVTSKSKRQSGFTLIELLVVISIIALLISILLPALSRAKSTALTTACRSNIRQVGIAMEAYASDTYGYLPAGIANEGGDPADVVTWDRSLQEYAGKKVPAVPTAADPIERGEDLYLCPADEIERRSGFARSYSMLYFPNFYGDALAYGKPIFRDDFTDLSTRFIMTEWHNYYNIRLTGSVGCVINDYYYFNGRPLAPLSGDAPYLSKYHDGVTGGNFLFMDGHVKFIHSDEAYAPIHW